MALSLKCWQVSFQKYVFFSIPVICNLFPTHKSIYILSDQIQHEDNVFVQLKLAYICVYNQQCGFISKKLILIVFLYSRIVFFRIGNRCVFITQWWKVLFFF